MNASSEPHGPRGQVKNIVQDRPRDEHSLVNREQQHANVINSVVLKGCQRVDATTVLSLANIEIGTVIERDFLKKLHSSLFDSELFSYVDLLFVDGTLTVTVIENNSISEIIFEGNTLISNEMLLSEISAAPRQIINLDVIIADIETISTIYSSNNFATPSISFGFDFLNNAKVRIIYHIQEAKSFSATRTAVPGNKANYRPDIGRLISEKSGVRVIIDKSSFNWYNEDNQLFNRDFIPRSTHAELERAEDALARIYHIAIANGYNDISQFILENFPESIADSIDLSGNSSLVGKHTSSAKASIPETAPEKYQGLRGPETPPDFVKRVYAPWLGKGLDRAHIKQLDPTLWKAIQNWQSRPGNEWPADVDLPTRGQQNARIVAGGPVAIREHLGKFTGQELIREAARLRTAQDRNKT